MLMSDSCKNDIPCCRAVVVLYSALIDYIEFIVCCSGHAHAYKEMLFPKDCGLIAHGLHIWPRNSHMMMALANQDGSMTGTLYMDADGDGGYVKLKITEKMFNCKAACLFSVKN